MNEKRQEYPRIKRFSCASECTFTFTHLERHHISFAAFSLPSKLFAPWTLIFQISLLPAEPSSHSFAAHRSARPFPMAPSARI